MVDYFVDIYLISNAVYQVFFELLRKQVNTTRWHMEKAASSGPRGLV